jgi:hypothetical protein
MQRLLKSILVLIAMIVVLPSWSTHTEAELTRKGIAVGVVVEDLQKSFDFYTKVIGMVR